MRASGVQIEAAEHMATTPNQPWYQSPLGAGLILALITAILGFAFAVWQARLDGNSGTHSDDNDSEVQVRLFQASPSLGETDAFRYTLLNLKCGVRKISTEKARGQFCVARLSVVNKTNADQIVTPSATLLVGTNRYPFRPRISPSLYGKELFPNTGAVGDLVFDILPGAQPTTLLLSDGGGREATMSLTLVS